MAQHGFQMGGHGGNGIDPNDLTTPANYPSSFPANFSGSNDPSGAFQPGAASFGDDELLDGLHHPSDQSGISTHGNFGALNEISVGFPAPGIYSSSHHGLQMGSGNGFSRTPDGDPIQSPFAQGNFGQYSSMGHHAFGSSLHSPPTYGSPLADVNEAPEGFLSNHRPRLQQTARPQPVSARTSLTPNNATLGGLSINSDSAFAQPIRAGNAHHEKSHSAQWMHTPNSLQSLPGSNLSSPPVQAGFMAGAQNMHAMMKGGTSMPTKLHMPAQVSSQEAKKRRRRESHNLVERRRRDNINERIQDLSKMVPAHRLEDEKIRKMIQNGGPVSPTLGGISSPTQATSALAGPNGKRAAGVAGNITTGLPIDEKDKGPNKGDILNGAVSWTRDLMWMLQLKLQQQEELINALQECGGSVPFEITDDERRMQTELMETLHNAEDDAGFSSYSRTAGSGLRVPHHTNYKGDPLPPNAPNASTAIPSAGRTPGSGADMLDADVYLDYGDNNDGELDYKEEDEYGMDLTH